jgi:hypothetical protein
VVIVQKEKERPLTKRNISDTKSARMCMRGLALRNVYREMEIRLKSLGVVGLIAMKDV